MAAIPAHFPLAQDLPEQHPLNALRFDYANGRCHYFALALAAEQGLELAILWDSGGDEPAPLHVFCCEGLDGRAVDAYGVVADVWETLVAFDQEWNLARPKEPAIELTSRQEVLDLFLDGVEPDPAALAQARADLDRLGFGRSPRPELGRLEETAPPTAGARDAEHLLER